MLYGPARLTFAHDDIVNTSFEALMVVDKCKNQILLLLLIYQVVIRLIIPDDWRNIIDIESN